MSHYEGTYAIRLRRLAQRDMNDAINRIAILTDEKHAAEWHKSLLDKFAALASLPRRAPIAEENRLFRGEVRVIPYRFGSSGAFYRIFYSIHEPAEDAPFIQIMHIRHSARKPMTRAEAREIEKDE